MATFAGRNSPAALAALAPSINNLAAAQRAKSQAAAGLLSTINTNMEKQREQEERKQKNQAALAIANDLIKDPAFKRQIPGVTDAAGLVKLAGAENVLDIGMKTTMADRAAQQSEAQIRQINANITDMAERRDLANRAESRLNKALQAEIENLRAGGVRADKAEARLTRVADATITDMQERRGFTKEELNQRKRNERFNRRMKKREDLRAEATTASSLETQGLLRDQTRGEMLRSRMGDQERIAYTAALADIVDEKIGSPEELAKSIRMVSPENATKLIDAFNTKNPENMLVEVKLGKDRFGINTKTSATFHLGTGEEYELSDNVKSKIAAVNKSNKPPEVKEREIENILSAEVITYDPLGMPVQTPNIQNENVSAVFSAMGEEIFNEDGTINQSNLDSYLARDDISSLLTPEERELFLQKVQENSLARRRQAIQPLLPEAQDGGFLSNVAKEAYNIAEQATPLLPRLFR